MFLSNMHLMSGQTTHYDKGFVSYVDPDPPVVHLNSSGGIQMSRDGKVVAQHNGLYSGSYSQAIDVWRLVDGVWVPIRNTATNSAWIIEDSPTVFALSDDGSTIVTYVLTQSGVNYTRKVHVYDWDGTKYARQTGAGKENFLALPTSTLPNTGVRQIDINSTGTVITFDAYDDFSSKWFTYVYSRPDKNSGWTQAGSKLGHRLLSVTCMSNDTHILAYNTTTNLYAMYPIASWSSSTALWTGVLDGPAGRLPPAGGSPLTRMVSVTTTSDPAIVITCPAMDAPAGNGELTKCYVNGVLHSQVAKPTVYPVLPYPNDGTDGQKWMQGAIMSHDRGRLYVWIKVYTEALPGGSNPLQVDYICVYNMNNGVFVNTSVPPYIYAARREIDEIYSNFFYTLPFAVSDDGHIAKLARWPSLPGNLLYKGTIYAQAVTV